MRRGFPICRFPSCRKVWKIKSDHLKTHIPYTIITGFLGSGKTTLINRILKESAGVHFALIINEFGEIGIDGGLIKASEDFVRMDNGCLCCVLSEDLVATIGKLKQRDDYDVVVLETTGIADPLPIAWPFLRPEFNSRFRFAGIVTVVDCLHLDAMMAHSEQPRLQIERADFIYLSKTDLAGADTIKRTCQKLETINPNARLVLNTDPDWLPLMFDFSLGREVVLKKLVKDKAHHDFQSLSIPLTGRKIRLDDIEDFFEALPKTVFRAKAVFSNAVDGRKFVIHSVCGRVEFYEAADFKGGEAAVFIGRGFDGQWLKASFEALFLPCATGSRRPDGPPRQTT